MQNFHDFNIFSIVDHFNEAKNYLPLLEDELVEIFNQNYGNSYPDYAHKWAQTVRQDEIINFFSNKEMISEYLQICQDLVGDNDLIAIILSFQ